MSMYAEGDINSDAKGSGARANKGKISLSLIPFHLLGGLARVFMGGKMKYAEWNWAKGMAWSSCMDCTLRHLIKWWFLGEECDPESGEHHLDHVLANILMLKHYTKVYPEGDNRPPASAMFAGWMEDFCECFDEDAYLDRNPDIKAVIDEREGQEVGKALSQNLADLIKKGGSK